MSGIPPNSKVIPGYYGFYRVDQYGVVWSCRLKNMGCNRRDLIGPWRKMKLSWGDSGRLVVNLRRNGKQRIWKVHQLVLETFVGPRPPGMEGCHWDDCVWNNAVSNLRWATRQANSYDAFRNGRYQLGERCHMAKLVRQQVDEMRQLYSDGGWSYRSLGRKYGVFFTTVSDVIKRRTWTHI